MSNEWRKMANNVCNVICQPRITPALDFLNPFFVPHAHTYTFDSHLSGTHTFNSFNPSPLILDSTTSILADVYHTD